MALYAVHFNPHRLCSQSRNSHRIAKDLKTACPSAIQIAAAEMAALLPDSPIWLVPIPNSKGNTSANLALCQAIRKLIPAARICDGLTRESPVESSCLRRKVGKKGLTLRQHKMKRKAPPLLHLPVWFVDNIVTTGTTFKAAHKPLELAKALHTQTPHHRRFLPEHSPTSPTPIGESGHCLRRAPQAIRHAPTAADAIQYARRIPRPSSLKTEN